MKAPRKYRGKYPDRISTVYSVAGFAMVITNDGTRYSIKPVTRDGRAMMPRTGKTIGLYQQSANYEVTR